MSIVRPFRPITGFVAPLEERPAEPSPPTQAGALDPVLRVRNLGVRLGPDLVVMVRSLEVRPGEVLLLKAPSGAGKSTVLGLISGAIASSGFSGEIHEIVGRVFDRRVPRRRLAGPETLGFVLQTNALISCLTAIENIELPLRIAGRAPDPTWRAHLMEALGIGGLGSRRPAQISVGQRQRVAIARALIGPPALLLLDEPVSSLDPGNVAQVEALIRQLAEEARSAVVLASHHAGRGAFRDARRATHAVRRGDGVTYSIFGTEGAAR